MLKRLASWYLSRSTQGHDLDRRKIENFRLNCARILAADAEGDERKVLLLKKYLSDRGVKVETMNDVKLRHGEYTAWLSTH